MRRYNSRKASTVASGAVENLALCYIPGTLLDPFIFTRCVPMCCYGSWNFFKAICGAWASKKHVISNATVGVWKKYVLRSHDETKHKKIIIIPTSQSMHISTKITGLQLQPMEERREWAYAKKKATQMRQKYVSTWISLATYIYGAIAVCRGMVFFVLFTPQVCRVSQHICSFFLCVMGTAHMLSSRATR